jgi:hypothetical protein
VSVFQLLTSRPQKLSISGVVAEICEVDVVVKELRAKAIDDSFRQRVAQEVNWSGTQVPPACPADSDPAPFTLEFDFDGTIELPR